ncbi:group III truncated hemoglobin [Fodinicurvata halophila]|uniref:Group III truncated hemoglobin n=1 Tax=Fodinicurvata halophila TaxID=1419723 RepID=A0ABV8UPA4_9PROT
MHPHPDSPAAKDPAETTSRTPITEALIERLVRDFHGRIRRDPVLGPLFLEELDHDWDAHLERMCAFWSSEMLGTGRYRGRPIPAHQNIRTIRPAHFDRWLGLFRQSAFAVCERTVALAFVDRAERSTETLKSTVFQRADLAVPGALRAIAAQEVRP